ncbi:uncharacterized protein LOC144771879 [Lissotriton helveticus]
MELNQLNPRIKFTHTIHKETISFLDVRITMINCELHTEVFKKATDQNSSLLFQSFHPETLKKHLPTSQFIRLKRITSDQHILDKTIEDQQQQYLARGYPKEILEKSIKKVATCSKESLLTPKPQTTEQKTVCVLKFSTATKKIKKIINQHWALIKNEPDLTNLYSEQLTFAFKRSRNLKEVLTFKKPTKIQFKGMSKCLNCIHCNNVISGNTLMHPSKGHKIDLQYTGTCDTKNVIYAIKCPCGKIYVGQTERKIKIRISEHKSNIRTKYLKSAVASHWHECNHQISQLKFTILEILPQRCDTDPIKQRLQTEFYWIKKLNSLQPTGFNDRIEYSCFL